jgi:hypothetical protein
VKSALAILVAAMVAAPALAGCTTDAFCFSCNDLPAPDGGPGAVTASSSTSTGGGGAGGSDFTTGVGGDMSTSGGADACSADTENDAKNCGSCGNVCELLGAFPKCVKGACTIDKCAAGHVDHNGIVSDGCEYSCSVTNGGVEICDGVDNDCNDVIDDNFDLTTDVNNCGSCGTVCGLGNASTKCMPVNGFPDCVVATCNAGFSDLDKLAQNGCEYACPVSPPTAEICNDKDDNCDGQINEGNPGGGVPCESTCPGGVCVGECTAGTTLCAGSVLICVAGAGPTLETCDGKDNDCDGVVDNGFDFQTDPLNCGGCGNVCSPNSAIGGCVAAQCVIAACAPGHANLDSDASNGCEYACPVTPPTVESCNGLDDDCNGVVDDPAVIAAQKPPTALCYPTPGTPCAGADFQCVGLAGWKCNYGPAVEVTASGTLAQVETKCDGVDGNCNGQVDEAFSDLGTACDNGLLGACRDVGQRVCDPGDITATKCDLSVLPDPVPGAPSAELCNGVDDDCNGVTDDGIVDDMALVTVAGGSFLIDRYEASRTDATALSPGLNESRRCVVAGRIPWTFTTQAEAAAACASTGARLCTGAEMQAACESATQKAYPYGVSYQPLTCNGLDFDGVPGGADDDILIATGAPATSSCATALGVHDLSGNAAEWTSTVTGNTGAPQNLSIFLTKGGSYKTPALGLTCQFSLSRLASNAILPDLGFRCCHD